ncbi:DeoR/GlpR family DNA-binding transcription regulator [Microbacterium terrisoli]|uniref:DeoR/GlpR family DNA-binding transcription regulator n=1 Tax=Microbacterium terrisoli TaxID=3242192 RepID=UPI002804FC12|nr:DeoR/GlpR family DNA-binding transcription regulator [Microbacterium protaetiae]
MRYTSAPARRVELERLLASEGYVSSADAALRMGVSEMTIRRDLRLLEVDGRVRRVAGGAAPVGAGMPFERRDEVDGSYKRLIAEAAVAEIAGCRTVALDAGTTVAAMTPLLRAETVVTHSLPVITALASRRPESLVAVGGHYQVDTRAFAGPFAEAMLRNVRTDVAVLSATALTADGLWGTNALDAAIKRILAAQAERVVVVADGAKLGARAPLRIADTAIADVVVTDARADVAIVAALRARGLTVSIAAR